MPTSPPSRSPRPIPAASRTLSPPSSLFADKPADRRSTPRQLLATPPSRHVRTLWLTAAALLIGCANPGPPRPPSLNLPTPVSDLHADRIGNAVHLSWTTPDDTTDDLPLRGAITAVLCRTEPTRVPTPPPSPATRRPKTATHADLPPAASALASPSGTASAAAPLPAAAAPAARPVPCTWSLRLPVSPGASTAIDPLLTSTQPATQTTAQTSTQPATQTTAQTALPPSPPGSTVTAPTSTATQTLGAPDTDHVPSPGHPASLLADPPRLLRYTVRLENSSGRAAEPSPPAFAAAGAAPSAVVALHLTPRPTGAQLNWQLDRTPATAVQLTRTQPRPARTPTSTTSAPATPAGEAAAPAATTDASAAHSPSITPSPATSPAAPPAAPRAKRHHHGSRTPPSSPAPTPRAATTEVRLLAAPAGTPDPGGTLDLTAPFDTPLTWRAERVRTVTVAGLPLTLHSDPAPALTATLADTFPPAPPTGLVAVDGTSPSGPAVDLSWEPNTEPDLAGYVVYRTELPAGASSTGTPPNLPVSSPAEPWQTLTPAPITAPAFHDPTARPGIPYRYRVTAVDRAGNPSAPCPDTPITLALPPRTP